MGGAELYARIRRQQRIRHAAAPPIAVFRNRCLLIFRCLLQISTCPLSFIQNPSGDVAGTSGDYEVHFAHARAAPSAGWQTVRQTGRELKHDGTSRAVVTLEYLSSPGAPGADDSVSRVSRVKLASTVVAEYNYLRQTKDRTLSRSNPTDSAMSAWRSCHRPAALLQSRSQEPPSPFPVIFRRPRARSSRPRSSNGH